RACSGGHIRRAPAPCFVCQHRKSERFFASDRNTELIHRAPARGCRQLRGALFQKRGVFCPPPRDDYFVGQGGKKRAIRSGNALGGEHCHGRHNIFGRDV